MKTFNFGDLTSVLYCNNKAFHYDTTRQLLEKVAWKCKRLRLLILTGKLVETGVHALPFTHKKTIDRVPSSWGYASLFFYEPNESFKDFHPNTNSRWASEHDTNVACQVECDATCNKGDVCNNNQLERNLSCDDYLLQCPTNVSISAPNT